MSGEPYRTVSMFPLPPCRRKSFTRWGVQEQEAPTGRKLRTKRGWTFSPEVDPTGLPSHSNEVYRPHLYFLRPTHLIAIKVKPTSPLGVRSNTTPISSDAWPMNVVGLFISKPRCESLAFGALKYPKVQKYRRKFKRFGSGFADL